MARPRKSKLINNARLAVAYLRISTTDQRLDQQRDAIEKWAERAGVKVVLWCSDEGVSGATPLDERPAMLDALAGIKAFRAGYLVAAKRDRLARDVSNAAAIERLTMEAGAKLVTADGLDSSDTPEGQLLRTLIDAMAQYERALIRARTKAALHAKAKRGEVVGSIPFGSKAVGGRLVPHDAEQRALSRMRALRAAGVANTMIVVKLTQEGHEPRGKAWHATTVQRALCSGL